MSLESCPRVGDDTKDNLSKAGINDLGLEEDFDRIIKDLEAGGDLDQNQIEEYNRNLKANIKTRLNDIEVKLNDKLQIKDSDSRDRKLAKVKATKGLFGFFKALFDWVIKALEWVITKIYEGIKWCFDQVTGFFKSAVSFFT